MIKICPPGPPPFLVSSTPSVSPACPLSTATNNVLWGRGEAPRNCLQETGFRRGSGRLKLEWSGVKLVHKSMLKLGHITLTQNYELIRPFVFPPFKAGLCLPAVTPASSTNLNLFQPHSFPPSHCLT